jgi:Sialic acid synthase
MISLKSVEPLFVFEMANNHMGDVEHGIRIIRAFREIIQGIDFNFCIKLQHRDDSFIHPNHVDRKDHKLIKRFTETKLNYDNFKQLRDEIQSNGFMTMCTPWDEQSVDLMEALDFDIIKIASCSFNDWPLFERIAKTKKPIVASTAGAKLDEIDQVVSFFMHRSKDFAILHCVGEYPCDRDHLELNQIDLFKDRYSEIPIGFSTHEDPENFDSIRIAIAKGATIFEKHVGVPTDKYELNKYSATPSQSRKWLEVAQDTFKMCGVAGRRKDFTEKETSDLRILFRGVYAGRDLQKGDKITSKDTFLAMPNVDGQLVARQLSKYTEFYAEVDFQKDAPLMIDGLKIKELRDQVKEIIDRLRVILKESKVVLPPYVDIEISHHYGIEKFSECGAVLVSIINRAYSKMLVIMFPGQSYPRHHHIQKDESYHILHGDLKVEINGAENILKRGDIISINHGQPHSFKTTNGVIIEEIATTYIQGDSLYEDNEIDKNNNRKTLLTVWPEWLEE